MSTSELVSVEYDFIRLDTALGDLLERVSRLDLAEARASFDDLYTCRLRLRRALHRLDEPISIAVAQHQAEAAPF